MAFDTLETEWGGSIGKDNIVEVVQSDAYSWLWAVHCETSTGVLNDLDMLKEVSRVHGLTLAVDCVSAIGTIPINLAGVAFASGVSGKGLLSYTGLSFVFHSEEVEKSDRLPRYLDLGAYVEADGVPYSQSSNLVSALDVALRRYEHAEEVFSRVGERAQKVRTVVEESGLKILAPENTAAPSIITVIMPEQISATQLGDNLYLNGFNVHYESGYLRKRNWLQISCMNETSDKELDNMLTTLQMLTAVKSEIMTIGR